MSERPPLPYPGGPDGYPASAEPGSVRRLRLKWEALRDRLAALEADASVVWEESAKAAFLAKLEEARAAYEEALSGAGPAHCAVPGCGGGVLARGLCQAHYRRVRVYGHPTGGPSRVGREKARLDRRIEALEAELAELRRRREILFGAKSDVTPSSEPATPGETEANQ